MKITFHKTKRTGAIFAKVKSAFFNGQIVPICGTKKGCFEMLEEIKKERCPLILT